MPVQEPTLVVLLTPGGRGAIATLLVEGPGAVEAVEAYFMPAAKRKAFGKVPLGRIVFGRWGAADGEEIVACRVAEERVELNCHGGPIAAGRITRDLRQRGCQAMSWTDWLRMRGEAEDRTLEAEAQIALAEARTPRTASILLDQVQGALRREIEAIRRTGDAARRQALLERLPLGRGLTRPWKIVLAGRPNVGKSSLINAIVGYARAIVFDQPGTTRDVVTAMSAIDGWPVELADTAGLRAAAEEIEAQGVARARQQMAEADLVLLIFDASQPFSDEDAELAAAWPAALAVFNKSDLARAAEPPDAAIMTSAVTREGIDELLRAISRRLVPNPPPPGAAVPLPVLASRV
jgi:tRNA modification GTPase